jgi:mycothiol synthase
VEETEIRPVRAADAPALVELMVAAEAVDHSEEHADLDDVREWLANPMIDPRRDWLVAVDDGQVVATAHLSPRAPADGEVSVTVEGVTHPAHRGRGHASSLVPRMVARAREYVAERGEHRPVVRAHARTDDTAAVDVLEAAGLVATRWTFLMIADLTAESAAPPAVPDGFEVSTWERVQADELMAAHNRAFVGHPGWTPWDAPMWEQWVSGARAHRPQHSLLLRSASGAIAAYVHTMEFVAVAERTGLREAYVAKVGTVPEFRRRGLASVALGEAMRRFRDAGFARAALDVDSHNPTGALTLYERAGFRQHQRYTMYEAPREPR